MDARYNLVAKCRSHLRKQTDRQAHIDPSSQVVLEGRRSYNLFRRYTRHQTAKWHRISAAAKSLGDGRVSTTEKQAGKRRRGSRQKHSTGRHVHRAQPQFVQIWNKITSALPHSPGPGPFVHVPISRMGLFFCRFRPPDDTHSIKYPRPVKR